MKKIVILLVLLVSLVLTSCSSVDLYIGENGNWWNGGEDLGITAQGPQGEQGPGYGSAILAMMGAGQFDSV